MKAAGFARHLAATRYVWHSLSHTVSYRDALVWAVAAVTGAVNALLVLIVGAFLFPLLPLCAAVLGYLASRRASLLVGIVLFIAYTATMAWILYEPYTVLIALVGSFLMGGFLLPLVSYGASAVRGRWRKPWAVGALAILLTAVGWSAYLAVPKYGYYYQVIVEASGQRGDLEYYLPVGTVDDKPYVELLDRVGHAEPQDGFAFEVAATEHGEMLRLGIHGLEAQPQGTYSANLILKGGASAPTSILRLLPRSGVEQVSEVLSEDSNGLIALRRYEVVERFETPVYVPSSGRGGVRVRLECRTDITRSVDFGIERSEAYSERLEAWPMSEAGWVYPQVQVVKSMSYGRLGD